MKDRSYQPMTPPDVPVPECCDNCIAEECPLETGGRCKDLDEEEQRNIEEHRQTERERGLSC